MGINKELSFTKKTIVFISSTVSIALLLFFNKFIDVLKNFTEKNVHTYDGIIDDGQIFILKITLAFFICIGFAISVIIVFSLHKKFFNIVSSFIDFEKIKNTFFIDPLNQKSKLAEYTFIISSIFAFTLHLKFLLFQDTTEETFLEYVCTFLFLISCIILFASLFKIKNYSTSLKGKKIIKAWLLICSVSLLFIFFEEISWGQHIFKWEASGVFKENNFQNETNLHNFINPFFRFIYPTAGMGLFLLLTILWLFYKGKKPFWLKLITPHQSLFLITFIMASSSYNGHSETFEEMLSIFILFYSIRIFISLKNQKIIDKN